MDSHIPAKKARYDCLNMPETSGGYCNDTLVEDGMAKDFWADNEFTAEEFDLLQSQVSSQAFNVETVHNLDPMTNEFQKLKEENYGLEGKIKMLHSTLEKNTQELEKERLEKMNLMEKYSEQQKQQQKSFEKEKECLETCLQFKEQELQAAFGKIAILEQKDKGALCANKAHIKRSADVSKDFISGTTSGNKSIVQKSNVMVQTESKEEKLSTRLKLWSNKACSAADLVISNMLCRAENLFLSTNAIIHEEKILQRNAECTSNTIMPLYSAHAKIQSNFTRIALSRLNLERENKFNKDSVLPDKLPSFQILHLLEQGLKECLNILKGIMSGEQQQTPNLSWSSIIYKDKDWFRLNILLNSEKLPLSPVVVEEIFSLVERQQVLTFQYLYHLLSLEAVRNILFCTAEKKQTLEKPVQKCNEISEKFIHPLIDDVLTASTPLFYEGKCINKSAVEWSLAVLIKSAEYNAERFDSYLPDISVCGITSGKCSLTSSFLLLHLLQYLLPFEFLTNHIGRHSSLCIYHSLFELCERIGLKDLGAFEMKIMTLVLNFLSGLLSNHSMLDATVDCHCIRKLFDVIMKILNTEIRLYTYKQSDSHFYFLQNGMSSLNWLRQLNIFQDQFANSQPMYVSLWNDSSLHLNTQLCNEPSGNLGYTLVDSNTETK